MKAAVQRPRESQESYDERRMAIEQLDNAIAGLASKINASTSLLLQMLREFDERAGYLKWGLSNTAQWLSWRCDLSLSAAREKVRCARALKELPRLMGAFAQGALSYSKVRAMTRVATPENEAALMKFAVHHSAAHVEERCRQMRNVLPEAAEDARSAYDKRFLRIWRHPHRSRATVTVELPLDEAELVASAIDKAAEEVCGNGKQGEHVPWAAIQADALVSLAREFLAGGAGGHAGTRGSSVAASSSVADCYQVVVHVDESALTSDKGRADLPVDTVRRLSCDGSLIRVSEAADGQPLSVGRKKRAVPAAIKRALWSRDRGCSFPGCTHTRFIDAHHIKHWSQGGETSLENLILLCSRHHRLVHEGGYEIRKDHRARWYFRRPDGRAIPALGYRSEDMVDSSGEFDEREPGRERGNAPHAAHDPSAEVLPSRSA